MMFCYPVDILFCYFPIVNLSWPICLGDYSVSARAFVVPVFVNIVLLVTGDRVR